MENSPQQLSPQIVSGKNLGSLRKKLLRRMQKRKLFWTVSSAVLLGFLAGLGGGAAAGFLSYWSTVSYVQGERGSLLPGTVLETQIIEKEYIPQTSHEEKVMQVVREARPSVVSIVITKDVPINPFFGSGTQREEVGGGTGFIVSEDGLVITNKHVVRDQEAEFTVIVENGDSFTAEVLARDPLQDLAVLKIEPKNVVGQDGNFQKQDFESLEFGNSDDLQIGQSVVAIGNALGEFGNTVSSGVVSGLGRTITATGAGFSETIEGVIQTDAAINQGNSGGPLLNLEGKVVGINTATVIGAQNIGFAIPANRARNAIDQVQATGEIVYPLLGVQYSQVTRELQVQQGLPTAEGVLVRGVSPGSGAARAGILEGDILIEMNGTGITEDKTLAFLIQEHAPGDVIVLKLLRNGEERILSATLGKLSSKDL